MTELRNLSLIREPDSQTYETSFSLHPLIQDWIKLRLGSEDRRAYTIESVRVLFHYLDSQIVRTTRKTRQTILSHLDAARENDCAYLTGGSRLGESSLEEPAIAFAGVLGQHGRCKEAMRLYKTLPKSNENHMGLDHPRTLKIVSYLANVYANLGQYEEAVQQYKRVMNAREKWPGLEHLDTLGTMQNLAVVYTLQTRGEEAEQLLEKALEGKEKQLGLENLDTLRTAHNLAIVYRKQRRYEDSVLLYERVLKGRGESLGQNHPDTLATLQNLALVYHDQGRYKDAEQLYQRALEQIEERLGWDHPDTVKVTMNLAKFYVQRERYEEALQISEKVRKRGGAAGSGIARYIKTSKESGSPVLSRRTIIPSHHAMRVNCSHTATT